MSAIEAYFAQEGIDLYYALYQYCVEEMKKWKLDYEEFGWIFLFLHTS
jgi:hypothetical protein